MVVWILVVSLHPNPRPLKSREGGTAMTTELINKTNTPRLICHFCGVAKPPHETVLRGHFRLCRECLLKHQIDILVQGTRAAEQNPDLVAPD